MYIDETCKIPVEKEKKMGEEEKQGITLPESVIDQATTTQQRMFKIKTNNHSTEERKQ